jgi:hypothetical protein
MSTVLAPSAFAADVVTLRIHGRSLKVARMFRRSPEFDGIKFIMKTTFIAEVVKPAHIGTNKCAAAIKKLGINISYAESEEATLLRLYGFTNQRASCVSLLKASDALRVLNVLGFNEETLETFDETVVKAERYVLKKKKNYGAARTP